MATNRLTVLFASSECVPFASSGGLGDVVDALPRILHGNKVNAIRVLPLYRRIKEANIPLKQKSLPIKIPVGLEHWEGRIWEMKSGKGPRTFFIEREELFDRSELYGPSHRPYDDNFERFLFFQKGIIALIDQLKIPVDIVHCNDWQTGLLPMLLKHGNEGRGRTANEKTLFTIHNLAYQGIFSPRLFPLTNLPGECFHYTRLEYFNQINCLKGGLAECDLITTVSETYAREIQTEEFGCGLESLLQHRSDDLVGIINGVDYQAWNPKTDSNLVKNYTPAQIAGKKACKSALISRFGLKEKKNTLLIGMISRLAEQKGFEIIRRAISKCMNMDVQFVLLGSGDPKIEKWARTWEKKWPERFSAEIGFEPGLAHQIEAGADLFLMPSRFEPCGLNQLYSLKYGTLPLVHDTGGLADTIVDLNDSPKCGTGFKMKSYTVPSLLDALQRAVDLYADSSNWETAMKRAMNTDFSWERTSGNYLEVYRKLCDKTKRTDQTP